MSATTEFVRRMQFVKIGDVLQILPAIGGYLCSLLIKIKHNNVWLICERASDARDNGYWFYKFMRENHPEIEAIYAINYNSNDYDKVAKLGRVIEFGSFTHWVYYWLAKKNISSQKEGKPNAALCFIFEVYLGMRKNRVFLQHGIICNSTRWLFKDVSKINLFLCSSKSEFEYIYTNYGYSKDELALTGLARYDNLLTPHQRKRQVLIMPSMREWLHNTSDVTMKCEGTLSFAQSEYFKTWTHFIHNPKLHRLLEDYSMNLVFYPHPVLHKFLSYFTTVSHRIIIGNSKDYDIQQLLMESSLLITDYSSIFFDFAYLHKPVIYYQFDYEKFRTYHYQDGYFSYTENGFGPVVFNEEELFGQIKYVFDNDLDMGKLYLERAIKFYAYRDRNNCERIYNAIMNYNKH